MDKILKSYYHSCKNRLKSACWNSMERIAGKNYNTAKAFFKFKSHYFNKRFSTPPLLIYSMGKVGSQSVQETLKESKIDMPIYHIHHLTHDYIASREERYKKYFHFRDTHYTDFDMLWRLQYLRKKLDKGLNGQKWQIVTLVRDPIAVNLSTFFHNVNYIDYLVNEKEYRIKSLYYDIDERIKIDDTETLLQLFLEKVDHDSPLSFFDNELKKVFGVDVYSSEFPTSRGYQIYNNNKAEVLLMRLENLNDCANKAFKDFLNIDELELMHTNIGNKKAYASIYRSFKKFVVMHDSYINKMYNSKFMRHFYDELEINKFKAKWNENTSLKSAVEKKRKVSDATW